MVEKVVKMVFVEVSTMVRERFVTSLGRVVNVVETGVVVMVDWTVIVGPTRVN